MNLRNWSRVFLSQSWSRTPSLGNFALMIFKLIDEACLYYGDFPGGTSGKEPTCQSRRHKRRGFDPWVGKMAWRRTWQPTPVVLPGEYHGQKSLVGYSPSRLHHNLTQVSTHTHTHTHMHGHTLWKVICFTLMSMDWKYQSHLEISFQQHLNRSLSKFLGTVAWPKWHVNYHHPYTVQYRVESVFLLQMAAAAAKSLQSCPTLCDPIDGSPPGSPIPGIIKARTLEWVAISFSNTWKWKAKVKSLSHVQLFATPWTTTYQAPPSMGFSRQEYSPWQMQKLPGVSLRPRCQVKSEVRTI